MIGFLTAALNLNGADALRRDKTPILGALAAAALTTLALFVLTLSPAHAGMTSMAGQDCAVMGGGDADECCVRSFNDQGIGLCYKSPLEGTYDRCGPGWCPDQSNCQIWLD